MKKPAFITMVMVPFRGRYETMTKQEAEELRLALGTLLSPHSSSLEDIVTAVCTRYQVSESQIYSRSRKGRVAWARQVSYYLCRRLTNSTLEEIGKHLGRDHGSVHYGSQAVGFEIEIGSSRAIDVLAIEANLLAARAEPTPEQSTQLPLTQAA